MGSLGKRVRTYAAPVLLVYTVMVTWALITTAWSEQDGEGAVPGEENRVRREMGSGGGNTFLDIIVQEERRHIKSFKNVMRSYRDAANQDRENHIETPEEQEVHHPEKHKRGRSPRRRNVLANDAASNNRRVNSKELNASKEVEKAPNSNNTRGLKENSNKLGSLVVVEEWDRGRAKRSKKSKKIVGINGALLSKANTHSNQAVASSLVDVDLDSNLRSQEAPAFQNKTSKDRETDYFVKFCDRVFDDPKVVPNICNRPYIEISNKKHIAVPKKSLSFKSVGEIRVFSTFLDVRGEPYVRAIVVGPSGQSSGPSTYWCVFPNLENATKDDTGTDDSGAIETGKKASSYDGSDNMETTTSSTVMSFFAASDGHGRASRFFIASCPVPQRAFQLFSQSQIPLRTIQMMVGSLETAFLGSVQDTIFVDVIINKHIKQDNLPVPSQSRHNLGKTLLIDVEATENKKSSVNDEVNSLKHRKLNKDHQKTKAFRVFELDDDDEDKEISRGKRHHSNPQAGKARSGGGITIPLPHTREVGDLIASCVAPLHGRVSAMQVIEFVELSLLLGVQHIVFYVPSSPELAEAVKVVRMYEARGLVTSLPWDLPGGGQGNQSSPEAVWARGRDVALNDCLYRTMHRFPWVLFLDLDEFFVPRVTSDLPSFLRYLAVQHNFNATRVTDLVFPSAFFPPPNRAQYKNLTAAPGFQREINRFSSLKSVHRTYFDQKQTLRMLRPETVARVGASERRKTAFTLSHRYASVHHYSFCPRTEPSTKGAAAPKPQGAISCSHLKVDWTMWRFKHLLVERATAAIRVLNNGRL